MIAMTNPNLTEIVCILDRSGSMDVIRDDAIGGFNAFLADQQRLPGEATLTLVLFNDGYQVVYQSVPIGKVKPLTKEDFVPGSMTALLDAVGRTIVSVGKRLTALPEEQRPGKVIVGILTDGQENASREYTRDQVFRMIRHQREVYGWEFAFMAAGQDAFEEAQAIGISKAMTVQFDDQKSYGSGAHMAYSSMCRSFRSGTVRGIDC
jgi:hypothetical protein